MENIVKNLLSHATVEHLDALLASLVDVISDMRTAEPSDARYRDDAYIACLALENMTLHTLNGHAAKQAILDEASKKKMFTMPAPQKKV